MIRLDKFICFLALFTFCSSNTQAQISPPTRPLIFVPGIFGSRLCKDGDPNQLVWGSAEALTRFTSLQLSIDGTAGQVKIEPCGEIDQFVYFGPLGQDVYGRFIEALTRLGYRRNETLFVFSYDWRLSNFENAKKLERELEHYSSVAKAKFPSFDGKFDIVAHSMGGIIATLFANTGDRRAARLITISTPFQGSVKILFSLQSGWGWVQRQLVSMEDVRKTALTFPSIFELLPIYRNCCAIGRPGSSSVIDILNADDIKKIQWFSGIPDDVLKQKLETAKKLHDALKAESRILSARMFGVQQETPEQIYISRDPKANADALITKINSSWMGDGTVMDYSAMIENDLWRLPGAISHDRIMSDSRILEQIQEALLNNRWPPEKITGEPLARCGTSDGKSIEIDGATLDGSERIFGPNEDASITLAVRSSQVSSDPNQLMSLGFQSTMVHPTGMKAIEFIPISDPEFGKERTGSNGFYTARFGASFKTPDSVGDAKVELRCGSDQGAISVWDFKVVQ